MHLAAELTLLDRVRRQLTEAVKAMEREKIRVVSVVGAAESVIERCTRGRDYAVAIEFPVDILKCVTFRIRVVQQDRADCPFS